MSVLQKIRCRVENIIDHGDHVYTVDLIPDKKVLQFRPGQFLHLALDNYDPSGFWPESRVFSIANSPNNRDQIRISYSVRGRFTARMERELEEDRWVWVKLPYGEFVIDGAKDIVLFAGGTGITAFTAFLENLMPEHPSKVYLVYGSRNRNLLIYRDMIENQVSRITKLKTFYFIENLQSEAKSQPTQPTQQIEPNSVSHEMPGCSSLESIWNRLENLREAIYYIAGPPAMIQALTGNLLKKGIAPEMIKVDAWE